MVELGLATGPRFVDEGALPLRTLQKETCPGATCWGCQDWMVFLKLAWPVLPTIVSYNSVLKAFAKAALPEEAERLLRELPRVQLQPFPGCRFSWVRGVQAMLQRPFGNFGSQPK
eukprot:s3109_g1.t1